MYLGICVQMYVSITEHMLHKFKVIPVNPEESDKKLSTTRSGLQKSNRNALCIKQTQLCIGIQDAPKMTGKRRIARKWPETKKKATTEKKTHECLSGNNTQAT